jgi:apolipoprotein N-acyltransferase
VPEAEAPTILANLSNIGWFGETIAVPSISRSRA